MSRKKKLSGNQRRTTKASRHASSTGSNARGRSKKIAAHKHHSQGKKKASARAASSQDSELNISEEPTLILLFNKPFQVLCQFTDEEGRDTLAKYIKIPKLYAAGRLDRDSEGLLLLTNNGMLQHRIAHPDFKLPKTYLVQLEGEVSTKALRQLCEGVKLNDGTTAPATAVRVEQPDWLWPRKPPIRFRKDNPTSWITLTITEGRNRQVRRMSAAVGYPTLRLIRTHIGGHSVMDIASGEYKEVADSLG